MLELNVVETVLGLMGTPISKVNTGTDMYRLMFRGIPMYGRRSVLLIFQIWSVNRFHSSMIGYGMKQLNYHHDPVGKELWYSKSIRFWLEAWVRIIRTLARLYLIDGVGFSGKKKSPNKLAQLAFWIYLELGGVVKIFPEGCSQPRKRRWKKPLKPVPDGSDDSASRNRCFDKGDSYGRIILKMNLLVDLYELLY